ncbi:MAG: mechanosensitive ion channel family protein [Candidatus Hodarchaeota archaeon]
MITFSIILDIFGDLKEKFIDDITAWFEDNFYHLILAILTIIIAIVIIRIINRAILRIGKRADLTTDTIKVGQKIVKWTLSILVIIIVLNYLGYETTFFGVLAIAAGTIIGFSAINTMGNAIAGIILMTSKPFKLGDRVDIGGFVEGDIADIGLVMTTIRVWDGSHVYLPNLEVIKNRITNYSKEKPFKDTLKLTMGYSMNVEEVKKTIYEAVSKVDEIFKDPPPTIVISDLPDFGAEYTIVYTIDEGRNRAGIKSKLRETIVKNMQEKGIDLTTAHIHNITQKTAEK